MKSALLIPARYGSTRFPGKPLAPIQGSPMILHTLSQAQKAKGFDVVAVVTDSSRIQKVVEESGATCFYDKRECLTGSDRLALANQVLQADYVVNCQGDEPLANPQVFEKVLETLKQTQIGWVTGHCLIKQAQLDSPNNVKIGVDSTGLVQGFWRDLPDDIHLDSTQIFKHIGVYGYSATDLNFFHQRPQSQDELKLSLEQLRVWPQTPFHSIFLNEPSISVDVPSDIEKVEQLLNLQVSRV